MRNTQTFILKVSVDPNEPGVLRGMLQTVANGEKRLFNDTQSLLAILKLLLCDSTSNEESHMDNTTGVIDP